MEASAGGASPRACRLVCLDLGEKLEWWKAGGWEGWRDGGWRTVKVTQVMGLLSSVSWHDVSFFVMVCNLSN